MHVPGRSTFKRYIAVFSLSDESGVCLNLRSFSVPCTAPCPTALLDLWNIQLGEPHPKTVQIRAN